MSHRQDGLVSVVMPAFNAAATIRSAIASVQRQTRGELELLVADDGSSDGTVEIVRAEADSDPRIRLLQGTGERGPAHARNRAIAACRATRWLAFCDSDDVWIDTKLEQQIEAASLQDAGLVYAGFWRISEDGRRAGSPVRVPERLTATQLMGNTVIATSTVMLDMHACGRPTLDPSVGYDDFELWTRLLCGGVIAAGVQSPLAAYRVRRSSVSSRKVSMSRHVWAVLRERRGVGRLSASRLYAAYALRAIVKHWRHRPRQESASMLPPAIMQCLATDRVAK